MAFTPVTGDTEISPQRASKTITATRGVPAYTRKTAVSGKPPIGKTALTFRPLTVPQPARTEPIDRAPSRGPNIRGKQGPFGKDSIGNAIKGAAELLSPLIADAFQPDTLGGRGGMTSEQHAAFSNMGNVTAIPAPAPAAPVFTPATSFPASFNEGGFIRKRT
jgi:hypothetical protein